MSKTAIIYSFNTKKTAKIAGRIRDEFGQDEVEMLNAEDITGEQFTQYDTLILGVATWFDGELPNYWDEFIPELEELDLHGKRIALYGLGDQKGYPQNFIDGVGILAEILEELGAELIGFTPVDEYTFESSRALREDRFCGLAIDFENQGSMNRERVASWVKQLKEEFFRPNS